MAAPDMLTTFQKHIDDMRNLSLCKICIKPFYEPFILPCGHTYCYSCLASWFGGSDNRRSKKSCPDCRAQVKALPSPNYLLRDLVHMFIGRVELLPEDETVQEHQKAKEEEAVLLAADRAGLGLFKGAFLGTEPQNSRARDYLRGILDPEDNVVRCPECHWELEEGECNRCGFHEFENSDSDLDHDSDNSLPLYDSEMDDEDDHDHEFEITIGGDQIHHNHGTIRGPTNWGTHGASTARIPTFSSDEEDDSDDDMDGFIDNEAVEGDGASEADTESTMTIYNRQTAGAEDDHVSISSETSSHGDAMPYFNYAQRFQPPESSRQSITSGDESEAATNYDELTEDSDHDNTTPTQPARRSGMTRVVLSSDDEDEDESNLGGHPTAAHHAEQDEDDDDDDDDEDDDESTTEGDSDSEEDSDDSIRPPQASNQRRLHLATQQARRSNPNSYPGYRGRANPPYGPPRQQPFPQRQQSQRGRGSANRYQPYQRPSGRRIPVGGENRDYPV